MTNQIVDRTAVYHTAAVVSAAVFTDPDGVMLDLSCCTEEFSDDEPNVVGRTDAERRPRPQPGPAS